MNSRHLMWDLQLCLKVNLLDCAEVKHPYSGDCIWRSSLVLGGGGVCLFVVETDSYNVALAGPELTLCTK